MMPAASVSGLYFAHPQAQYFAVGKIGRDQVADYRAPQGHAAAEVERWLAPTLAYEPETASDPTSAPAARGTAQWLRDRSRCGPRAKARSDNPACAAGFCDGRLRGR